MSFIYLFVALVIILIAGIWLYTYFRTQHKPQTDTLYTDALNAMVKADKFKAITLLRDVVKQDSNHINAYLQLGNILREDNPEQAVKIHQSLTVRPNLSIATQLDIHQALARDYEELDRLDPAKNEAEQILRLSKKNIWALEFLLRLAERNEDWDSASHLAKQLQKLTNKKGEHDLAKFDVYKGLQFMKDGKYPEALIYFDKALKISPDFGLPYKYKGDIYEDSRDLVKAIKNWEFYAMKDSLNASNVFSKIEAALFDLGRYSEVENFYRRILENDPKNFEAIIHLANVLEEKGESQAALSLVEESLDSGDFDVRGALMKLKLSLTTSTPMELSHQIDSILEILSGLNDD